MEYHFWLLYHYNNSIFTEDSKVFVSSIFGANTSGVYLSIQRPMVFIMPLSVNSPQIDSRAPNSIQSSCRGI